jgi:hypothetical protein
LITRWRKIKKVSYKDTKMIDLKMKIKDVEMDCEVLEELTNNNLFIYNFKQIIYLLQITFSNMGLERKTD